ncbi:Sel1 domain-containing protein repeat-containing protein [Cupriavidus taiwanensis]|uniref:tetratricopeptide repeat protein n=1 Tax=Cupriavidus taiwanensis TaxID=164546 RepID=UPI000E13E29C|nr:tetratricopeptide repeat protein [Cupriavidus taiwanensis]SPA02704.1 Sel1 domain-containing protein repeat-containing protein [Cupriavidus taiwanensis]
MDTLPFRVATPVELEQLGPAGLRDKLAGPPQLALPWLGGAAVAGHLDAQMVLGQWFLAGHGVARDPVQAFAWFKHAAHAGHAGAANLAGRCYENGWGTAPDARAAAHWYTLAAERGSDWGMYNLATALVLGRGVVADRRAALRWYQRAAALGHAKSLNILGGFHEDGWEVAQDPARAVAYYRQAAEGGDFRGQFNYARMLALAGREAEAQQWIRRVPQTATGPFIDKMLAFLRDAPQQALQRLYAHASVAAQAATVVQTAQPTPEAAAAA